MRKKHCMINVSLKIWIASKKTVRIRQKNSQGSLFVCPSHLQSVLLCCDISVLLFFVCLLILNLCIAGKLVSKGKQEWLWKEERVAINPFLVWCVIVTISYTLIHTWDSKSMKVSNCNLTQVGFGQTIWFACLPSLRH